MKKEESVWTILSLKEYMCTVFQEYANKIEQKFLAMDRAVTKAEMATEKRFESVNEFRAQLADQQRTFLSRNEYELAHNSLEDKVNYIKECVNKIESRKEGSNVVWLYLVAAISILISVCSLLIDFLK